MKQNSTSTCRRLNKVSKWKNFVDKLLRKFFKMLGLGLSWIYIDKKYSKKVSYASKWNVFLSKMFVYFYIKLHIKTIVAAAFIHSTRKTPSVSLIHVGGFTNWSEMTPSIRLLTSPIISRSFHTTLHFYTTAYTLKSFPCVWPEYQYVCKKI